MSLSNNFPRPENITLEGRYCRLEPLSRNHLANLFEISRGQQEKYTYLMTGPPEDMKDIDEWFKKDQDSSDVTTFAVIDLASGRCEGRQVRVGLFQNLKLRLNFTRVFFD